MEKYLSFCQTLLVIYYVSSKYMYLTEVFIQEESVIICHTAKCLSNHSNYLTLNAIDEKTTINQVPDA